MGDLFWSSGELSQYHNFCVIHTDSVDQTWGVSQAILQYGYQTGTHMSYRVSVMQNGISILRV